MAHSQNTERRKKLKLCTEYKFTHKDEVEKTVFTRSRTSDTESSDVTHSMKTRTPVEIPNVQAHFKTNKWSGCSAQQLRPWDGSVGLRPLL